jgi:argininosuccinate lyase
VGQLVRQAERLGVSLTEVPEAELAGIAPELHPACLQTLNPNQAVAARTVLGGPAPAQVMHEVERLAAELKALGFEV